VRERFGGPSPQAVGRVKERGVKRPDARDGGLEIRQRDAERILKAPRRIDPEEPDAPPRLASERQRIAGGKRRLADPARSEQEVQARGHSSSAQNGASAVASAAATARDETSGTSPSCSSSAMTPRSVAPASFVRRSRSNPRRLRSSARTIASPARAGGERAAPHASSHGGAASSLRMLPAPRFTRAGPQAIAHHLEDAPHLLAEEAGGVHRRERHGELEQRHAVTRRRSVDDDPVER